MSRIHFEELLEVVSAIRTWVYERSGSITFPKRLFANIMDRWTMKIDQGLIQ